MSKFAFQPMSLQDNVHCRHGRGAVGAKGVVGEDIRRRCWLRGRFESLLYSTTAEKTVTKVSGEEINFIRM